MRIHFHPLPFFFVSWAGALGGWYVRTGAETAGICVGEACIDERDGSVCGGVGAVPTFCANAAGSNRVIESAKRRLTHTASFHLALGLIASSFPGTLIVPDLTRGNFPREPVMEPKKILQ